LPKSYDEEAGGDPKDLIKVRAAAALEPSATPAARSPSAPRPARRALAAHAAKRAPRPARPARAAHPPPPAPRAPPLAQTVNELKTKPGESRVAACCALCTKTKGCKSWEYRCVGQGQLRGARLPLCAARSPPRAMRPAHKPRRPLRARSGSNMGYGCSLYKAGAERVPFEGCKCTQVSPAAPLVGQSKQKTSWKPTSQPKPTNQPLPSSLPQVSGSLAKVKK
jgi:hypothetical protein